MMDHTFAQRSYLSVNAGYGFQTSSQSSELIYNRTISNNTIAYEQVNVSLGKGVNFGLTYGYMFSKNIGAEVGLSFLIGGKTKSKDIYPDGETNYAVFSRMVKINPSLIISPGYERINPYAKMGFLIGSGSIQYEVKDHNEDEDSEGKYKFNGGLASGLTAGVGVLYKVNDRISVFAEINTINLSYAPKKGKLTKRTTDGIDQLITMSRYQKEIDFVDSYTEVPNQPPDQNSPRQSLKQKFSFGSVGLNFGVQFSL